ncbi:MAG TPA: amino acid adenylation domain-containing protein [Pyrinomonadaceae bacterium]|nr:amino acid adenylation domain-containing protein [Pyrinomonadaceae bacterium]
MSSQSSVTDSIVSASAPGDKRDLLQRYLSRAAGVESIAAPLERTFAARNGGLPLSFAQQRFWFINQLAPASPAYNIAVAIELIGSLDAAVLERSMSEIVRRHEILRTRFVVVEGAPLQLIGDEFSVPLPLFDLSDLPEPQRTQEAELVLQAEAATPFDLSELPLLRIKLLKLSEQHHTLLLNMHHIVGDSWSIGVLFRELGKLYEAFSSGKCSPLPDLEIQYADYALWEHRWLEAEVLERQLSYWREQLAGASPTLELPLDRPRPERESFRGSRAELTLPQEPGNRLRQLYEREGVTLYMTLLAAFQVLLAKYSGQEDILVGSPVAIRNQAHTGSLIGCFLNTLVMRTDLSGDPTFRELLRNVREVALGAFENQDVPFEKIVSELRPERSLSHSSIFQVMFVLENAPARPLAMPGLAVESRYLGTGATKFDLTLAAWEFEGSFELKLDYNTDLFDSQTIERMLDHFQTLLERVAMNPGERLSALSLLKDAEREELISGLNAYSRAYPFDRSFVDLFQQQAERTPDATAVVFEEQSLSYAELNARSNQLGHLLREANVSANVCVGLLIDRSVEMLVGLLGILKAGGAYVPLDPGQPKARVLFQLQETTAPVLVTQKKYLAEVEEYAGKIVCLDRDQQMLKREKRSNPDWTIAPRDLAYVIFTSGTTGTPKGTLINHSSLTNYLCWFNENVGNEVRRLPVVCGLWFDMSLKQILAPLLRGDAVWLLPEHVISEPAALLQACARFPRVGLNLVPSLWWIILDEIESSGDADNVAYLIFGGEKLSPDLVARSFHALPHVRIWNLYGPTEATSNASGGRVFPEAPVTIGKPIANAQIFILDTKLQPVPIGVPGELHIGGMGLAQGYLNRTQLTAEKFIENPFAKQSGARLYKTGDRARFLADGSIEYLGRIDNQVKIRGHRVEPDEIEAVLNQHPQMNKSVVVAREDQQGEKRLVAYVVLSEEVETIISDLRRWVKQRLPGYAIPSWFVVLDELPLTPNGKLDRRSLPAPDGKEFLDNAFVAPRNTLELLLTKTWENVLKVQPIGVKNNFFDLGGDSFLAVRLFTQIANVYGKKLPPATLFHAPTIEQMASLLGEEQWSPPWSSLVPIQPGGSRAPLFCLHLAPGHVLFYRDLAQRLGLDQPVYGFQPLGMDGLQPHHTRIEEMACHYIREMRALQPDGPYYLAGSSSGGLIAFEMAQQLLAQDQKVGLVALFDTYAPGFHRLSFKARSLRYQAYRFMQRVHLHAGNLLLLERRGKVKYAREKATLVTGRMIWTIKKAIDKRFSGNSEPAEDQKRIDAAIKALREYAPKVYPGYVTLFRASKHPAGYNHDGDLGWEKFAAGVVVHEIPGYHGSIVMEPRVRVLAEQLRACLGQDRDETA